MSEQVSGQILLESTVGHLVAGDAIAINNLAVWGVGADGNNPEVQHNFQKIKGDKRGLYQPVGWTVPFSRSLDTVDVNVIEDKKMQDLLRNHHEMTGRLGGIAFVNAEADMTVKDERGIPDAIIPRIPHARMQGYSPVGNDALSKLESAARTFGVELVMTSANISGSQAEIVDKKVALDFALERGSLPVFDPHPEDDGSLRIKGSYPIVEARRDHFFLSRHGCFSPEIMTRLLDGYVLVISDEEKAQPNYPADVLQLEQLPADVRELRGHDLWLGIVTTTMGWRDEEVEFS